MQICTQCFSNIADYISHDTDRFHGNRIEINKVKVQQINIFHELPITINLLPIKDTRESYTTNQSITLPTAETSLLYANWLGV